MSQNQRKVNIAGKNEMRLKVKITSSVQEEGRRKKEKGKSIVRTKKAVLTTTF